MFSAGCMLSFGQSDDVNPNGFAGNAPRAFGDPLLEWDLTAITGSEVVLGVAFADDHFWFTAGGIVDSVGESNLIYKVSSSGTLVATYMQGTDGDEWGYRDLASDSLYLYGSFDTQIYQISRANGAQTGTTIPLAATGLALARGIAYDQQSDHFYVSNWNSSIFEIDRTGTVHNTIPNTHFAYGLSYERYTSGSPFVYVWHQDDDARLNRINLSGTDSGELFGTADPNRAAGGSEITPLFDPGNLLMLNVEQGDPNIADADYLLVYDLEQFVVLIPTMSEAMTFVLIGLLLFGGVWFLKKQRRTVV